MTNWQNIFARLHSCKQELDAIRDELMTEDATIEAVITCAYVGVITLLLDNVCKIGVPKEVTPMIQSS